MSSGESGDESSGIESPGRPSSTNNHIQLANSNNNNNNNNNSSSETIVGNSSRSHQQQDEARNINMNSVLYPAAALANIPQEVLLSLVQAGHLQVHQEEGNFYFFILMI